MNWWRGMKMRVCWGWGRGRGVMALYRSRSGHKTDAIEPGVIYRSPIFLHPRKRQNTERGPEAGVRGASPGVWVRRTGGGMYAQTEGTHPL